jgi:uroporphyrin-3 C-methyltransferase
LHEQRAAIQSRIGRLDEEQQSISNRLSLLASVMGRTERGWTLAEVEYLLRIASQRLQLQRDTASAERALEAADGRLREFADPHYLSVREQIARDLEAVRAVPAADVDGLAAALTSSQAGIDELPVAGTQYQPPATGADSAHGHGVTASSIGELGELVRSSLSGLFRLREHEQALKPMLPPDNEYFLRENLRLQLVAARVALLRADRAQYQAALATAIDWLNSYFDVSHAAVGQLAVQLEKIAAVDISPQLPDVSGSLRLLRQQMELSEQQAVLPVVPETADKAAGASGADEASP